MKKFLTYAALSVACACATVPAFASDDTAPVGVSLRVGIAYPTESDTRNNVGNSWLGAGIDFKIHSTQVAQLPPGYFSVSMDYAGRGDYRTVPLLLNYTTGKTFYASAGAGVTFGRFPQDDGVMNDKIRFAYSGAIGINFINGQVPIFLEGRYFGCENNRLGDFAVYVGARF